MNRRLRQLGNGSLAVLVGFVAAWPVGCATEQQTRLQAEDEIVQVKYDVKTGQVVQVVEFVPGSCDIHDVAVYNGQLYGVDAGEHPGWSIDNPAYQRPGFPPLNSPSGGYVFRIDLI